MRTLIVDAENVRRSIWPNVGREELARLCGRFAEGKGVDVVVVFDGSPPQAEGVSVRVLGTPGRSADDLVAEVAAASGGDVEVATSDRGLRARLPDSASVVGGGAFVRTLLALDQDPPGEP